jgi:hypothetical protein
MRILGLPYTPADRMTSFAASKISGSVLLPSRYSTPTAVEPSMITLLTVTSWITCKLSLHAPAPHYGLCLTVCAVLHSLLLYGTDAVCKMRRPRLLHIKWYQHPHVLLAAAIVFALGAAAKAHQQAPSQAAGRHTLSRISSLPRPPLNVPPTLRQWALPASFESLT